MPVCGANPVVTRLRRLALRSRSMETSVLAPAARDNSSLDPGKVQFWIGLRPADEERPDDRLVPIGVPCRCRVARKAEVSLSTRKRQST
jgi:hypothetical protein